MDKRDCVDDLIAKVRSILSDFRRALDHDEWSDYARLTLRRKPQAATATKGGDPPTNRRGKSKTITGDGDVELPAMKCEGTAIFLEAWEDAELKARNLAGDVDRELRELIASIRPLLLAGIEAARTAKSFGDVQAFGELLNTLKEIERRRLAIEPPRQAAKRVERPTIDPTLWALPDHEMTFDEASRALVDLLSLPSLCHFAAKDWPDVAEELVGRGKSLFDAVSLVIEPHLETIRANRRKYSHGLVVVVGRDGITVASGNSGHAAGLDFIRSYFLDLAVCRHGLTSDDRTTVLQEYANNDLYRGTDRTAIVCAIEDERSDMAKVIGKPGKRGRKTIWTPEFHQRVENFLHGYEKQADGIMAWRRLHPNELIDANSLRAARSRLKQKQKIKTNSK